MTIKTFMPSGLGTASLLAGTTSANVAIDPNSSAVRVVNDGTATAFIRFGRAGVTTDTTHMPIRGGATETFTKGSNDYVAAIVASGTTQLYFTSGEGL